MKHNTNIKKHITMLCIAKNGRHCQKADYNRNGCRNQRCHPKIFSFPKEKEYHRCNGNDIKYRNIPPIHKHPPSAKSFSYSCQVHHTWKAYTKQSFYRLARYFSATKKHWAFFIQRKTQCFANHFNLFPAILPADFPQTVVPLRSVLPFPTNPDVFSRYG